MQHTVEYFDFYYCRENVEQANHKICFRSREDVLQVVGIQTLT
jgi:hypothetical protein